MLSGESGSMINKSEYQNGHPCFTTQSKPASSSAFNVPPNSAFKPPQFLKSQDQGSTLPPPPPETLNSNINFESFLCETCGQFHSSKENHRFHYAESVNSELYCPLCNNPLIDPLETKCGHTFCNLCLKQHLVTQALCPVDQKIINYLECQQTTSIVRKLLDKLQVACPNKFKPAGCEVVVARTELEAHLKACNFSIVSCPYAQNGCLLKFYNFQLPTHKSECPFGPQNCSSKSITEKVVQPPAMPYVNVNAEFSPVEKVVRNQSVSVRSTPTASNLYCTRKIRPGEISQVVIDRSEQTDLGISFVGGIDTPLLCIMIQEIYLDGVVAQDGRLKPGDQILEANGIDLTRATHHMARLALAAPSLPSDSSDSANALLKQFRLMVYRERNGTESVSPRVGFNRSISEKLSIEREGWFTSLKTLKIGLASGLSALLYRFFAAETLRVTLRNRPGIKLGIKLAVKK